MVATVMYNVVHIPKEVGFSIIRLSQKQKHVISPIKTGMLNRGAEDRIQTSKRQGDMNHQVQLKKKAPIKNTETSLIY